MRILGLDYGERRVGVAVSDEGGRIALPLATLNRRKNFSAELKNIAVKYEVDIIVAGHPLDIGGAEGAMARKVRREAESIAKILGVECVLWDERFTSRQADAVMSPLRGEKWKKDMVAATMILQSYLDHLHAAVTGSGK